MPEKRIKSALEIAMEKAGNVSGLTEEELTELKEREYKPRGVAIAKKYLETALRERDFPAELNSYK